MTTQTTTTSSPQPDFQDLSEIDGYFQDVASTVVNVVNIGYNEEEDYFYAYVTDDSGYSNIYWREDDIEFSIEEGDTIRIVDCIVSEVWADGEMPDAEMVPIFLLMDGYALVDKLE